MGESTSTTSCQKCGTPISSATIVNGLWVCDWCKPKEQGPFGQMLNQLSLEMAEGIYQQQKEKIESLTRELEKVYAIQKNNEELFHVLNDKLTLATEALQNLKMIHGNLTDEQKKSCIEFVLIEEALTKIKAAGE